MLYGFVSLFDWFDKDITLVVLSRWMDAEILQKALKKSGVKYASENIFTAKHEICSVIRLKSRHFHAFMKTLRSLGLSLKQLDENGLLHALVIFER